MDFEQEKNLLSYCHNAKQTGRRAKVQTKREMTKFMQGAEQTRHLEQTKRKMIHYNLEREKWMDGERESRRRMGNDKRLNNRQGESC